MKKNIILLAFLCFANASDNFYYQNHKKVFLSPLKTARSFQKLDTNQTDKIEYYKTDKGQIVGINRELILKLKEEKILDSLIEKYQLNLKKKLAKNLYLVEVKNTEAIFNTSNKLYNEDNVSYAQPDFIKNIKSR